MASVSKQFAAMVALNLVGQGSVAVALSNDETDGVDQAVADLLAGRPDD